MSISYNAAARLQQLTGDQLVKTFFDTKRGRDFLIVGENGGPVTEDVAARLMAHPECRPVDPGLLSDTEQSFSLFQAR